MNPRQVLAAEDSEQGCKLAVTKHPDIILMDLEMPVLDRWKQMARRVLDTNWLRNGEQFYTDASGWTNVDFESGHRSQEDRQMWLYVQTWLSLLTIVLTAAICFSVTSFMMGKARPQA